MVTATIQHEENKKMFLIRETALEILTKAYEKCDEKFFISKFDLLQFKEEKNDILKSLKYLAENQYIKGFGSIESLYPSMSLYITTNGINWVEDNLNK